MLRAFAAVLVLAGALGCADGGVASGDLPDHQTTHAADDSAGQLVAAGSDTVEVGWASVAIDAKGAATVSWIALDDTDRATVLVAVSPAAGEPFGAPVEIVGPVRPNVGATEKPQVTVRDGQTAVTWAGTPLGRHGDSTQVAVHVAREGLSFDGGLIVDDVVEDAGCPPAAQPVTEHATAAFAPDGELWLGWKQQCYGTTDRLVFGRESQGYAPSTVDARFTVHDCSPFDLGFAPDGTAMVAFRGVKDLRRETWMAQAPPGSDGFEPAVQVSQNDWEYVDVCPPEGPQLAVTAEETLVTWAAPDPEGDDAYAWISSSAEGADWSDAAPHGIAGSWVEWSSVALEEGGRAWHALEDWAEGTRLYVRDDGDWQEHPLTSPVGGPLWTPELATGGGRTALLGASDSGELWLIELGG